MSLSGVNWLGVIIALIVTFISGAIWFGPKTFYPRWIAAMQHKGWTRSDHQDDKSEMGFIFGSLIVAQIIQILILALFITTLQSHNSGIGILDGAIIGALAGIGFCAAPNTGHRLFAGNGIKVMFIENGNDILNLALAGAIIAGMN